MTTCGPGYGSSSSTRSESAFSNGWAGSALRPTRSSVGDTHPPDGSVGRTRRAPDLTVTARTVELRAIAQAIADALPAGVAEVVLTGSVSRGVADDVSDIEMLIVTERRPELDECYAIAAACGLTGLGTWGPQGVPTKRVSGYRDGVPIELIWWSHAHAAESVDSIFAGELPTSADALAHGIPLRTSGLLAEWQERLRHYPDELAAARIEDAALTWGGFAAAGLLTIIRPGMLASNALFWWAAAIRTDGVVRWPYGAAETAPIDDRDVAAVRTALTTDAFDAAWSDGQSMMLSQVVEYALEGSEPA